MPNPDLMRDENLRNKIDLTKYVQDRRFAYTNDIVKELAKPGRDPREKFEAFSFTKGVEKLEDVTPGMKLPGVVTNITAFGAFVDIGFTRWIGHISQLADRFVKNPNDVVKVHQKVTVSVLEVDVKRKRISLSLKKQPEA
jgi:uncharacterized protein